MALSLLSNHQNTLMLYLSEQIKLFNLVSMSNVLGRYMQTFLPCIFSDVFISFFFISSAVVQRLK